MLYVAKPQFLSNPENKQVLVSYLTDKLNAVPGVLCSKADDDALEALVDNPGKSVTLVGDDTDLIVLLLYHTQERRLFPGEPLFSTKESTWDISLLVDSVKGHAALYPKYAYNLRL